MPNRVMSRSRVTLATMEAAAIEARMASPLITALQSQPISMRSRPSTNTSWGLTGRPATARASAHKDARRMLSRSMRHGGANATATCALAQIFPCSFSRVCGSSFLESSSPRGALAAEGRTDVRLAERQPHDADGCGAGGDGASGCRATHGAMVRAAAPKSTGARLPAVKGGERQRLEQAQLLGAAPGRTEMVGRQPRSRLVEAALLAGEFETAADHPGHRPAAGHALAPARVVVLATAGLADELEDVAVAVGKIGHQPFAE